MHIVKGQRVRLVEGSVEASQWGLLKNLPGGLLPRGHR